MNFWDRALSLAAARHTLMQSLNAGEMSTCPCCEQTVFLYARRITGTMVRQLAQMCFSNHPLRSRDLINSHGGDHAKMVYWGLVQQDEEGFWHATVDGRDFLYDRIDVPEVAYVYNRKVVRFSDEHVSVRDRMGKRFNYEEMMG
tara:strand:+ start:2618 stop:3049 length:432 start_codon:yes stop_codon:yes gene_type:complete